MNVTPISGFPEWLPPQRRVEQRLIDILRKQFELFGFLPIETRAIEPLDVLLHKGDDKEIYVLRRWRDADDDANDRFGLHFDLTVPFARYVQEHESELVFPFKRYQIQKVWRGERKQEGRYREFYQCDIDVIGKDNLPVHFDAELPYLILTALKRLNVPPVCFKLSHRKVLEGFYQGLGITETAAVLRIVDKIAKIGETGVSTALSNELGLSAAVIDRCLALAAIRTKDVSFVDRVRAVFPKEPSKELSEGLSELSTVMQTLLELGVREVEVDLSIARGLDYYTGTVYETYLVDNPELGAICSGGRYDNLAQGGRNRLPGVGLSLGLTRLLGHLFKHGVLTDDTPPVYVLIMLNDEGARVEAMRVAAALRERGIGADVHHQPQNFGKQMKAAEKRGIPYVWFVSSGLQGEVKHLASGTQTAASADQWRPDITVD
ncbi:MAG: histidine--tRNA ligase [Gammaproteobacteria bacterium]